MKAAGALRFVTGEALNFLKEHGESLLIVAFLTDGEVGVLIVDTWCVVLVSFLHAIL